MKYSRLGSLGLAGVLLCSSLLARADTDADRIKRLEDQIKALQEQMQKLKDDQVARDKAQVASTGNQGGRPGQPPAKPPAAANAIRISGDIDTRFDLTGFHAPITGVIPEGDTGRLAGRFRLKLQTSLSQRSDAEIWLQTGQQISPTVAYTNFGDVARGKVVSFGRAAFNYYFGDKANPKTPSLTFGKMQLPFWRGDLGGWASEITWDNDVSPEGIALRLPLVNNKHLTLSDTTGFFAINQPAKNLFTGLTTNIYQIESQLKADSGFVHAAVTLNVIDNLNSGLLVPSVTPDGFIDNRPAQGAFLFTPFIGNQTTNGHYYYAPSAPGLGSNTFSIFGLSVQLAPKVRKNRIQPFMHYEYLNNGSVPTDNVGWGITLGLNKSKLLDGKATSRGDYTAWWTYRDVDPDAALGHFADSDLGAGTDYRGYQLGFNYRIQDNLAFRALWNDFAGSNLKANKISRLFLDVIRFF